MKKIREKNINQDFKFISFYYFYFYLNLFKRFIKYRIFYLTFLYMKRRENN